MRNSEQSGATTEARIQAQSLPESHSSVGRDAKILRLKQVAALVGLGKSSIYRKVQEGTFPKPIKLGSVRASGWISTEVYDWIDNQIRQSRTPA